MTELDWIKTARSHLGMRETHGSNRSPKIDAWWSEMGVSWLIGQAWCGLFVAKCLKDSGVKHPKHWYRALDYLNYGAKLKKPAYGCVAVKSRVGGGHVCFVVGRDKKTGRLACLGANQGNASNIVLYPESDFKEFRWYGRTSRPADGRYNLPILDGLKNSSSES